MAALQAAAASTEYDALFDEAMVLAGKIERPNPLLVMAVARSLGGQPWAGDGGPSSLSKEHREKVIKLLVAWYPRMAADSALLGPFAFYLVVGAVQASDRPKPYFDMLDDEVARWRKNTGRQKSQTMNMMIFGRRNESLLDPLGFPPKELSDFPENVHELLAAANDSPFRQIVNSEGGRNWDAKEVEALVQKTKDPTLRVLLANRQELPKIAEATIKEMLAKKPPQVDAYLLAAGKAHADSRFAEAVNLLEKVRQLPLQQEMRRRIDAAIVAAVLAAKEEKGPRLDELLKTGRDAAVRLRRQHLDQQQRKQLVSAFDDLGLKDEAKKLTKQLIVSGPAVSLGPGYAIAPVTRAAPTSRDRIDQLLASGKRDAAVRLLASELRSLVQQQTANPQNLRYYHQQMEQVKTRISDHGMSEEVLKSFSPGDGGNPNKLGEYALVLDLFGRAASQGDL